MLKAQWKKLIKEQSESDLSIREWCRQNNLSHGKFYYWQRIIREEALIKAGTLAVTGQSQFVELNLSITEVLLILNLTIMGLVQFYAQMELRLKFLMEQI